MSSGVNKRFEVMFAPLNTTGAAKLMYEAGKLSNALKDVLPKTRPTYIHINNSVCSYFATAAIEMWHRSIHSFLVSASLTDASPLWSSVAGYYSSHYSVRAIAHLLGYFQLYHDKVIFEMEIKGSSPCCNLISKTKNDGEHKYYWKIVKESSEFNTNPLFCYNEESQQSDKDHRNKGNYLDHINRFTKFKFLDVESLKRRVEQISSLQLSSVPKPDVNRYPDQNNVQLIAYHRMIAFRSFVDKKLGSKNKFWNANREPAWSKEVMNFQIVEPNFPTPLKKE